MHRKLTAVLASLGMVASFGACTTTKDSGRLDVVAGFYPLAFLVAQIGGDAVAVTDLTPRGVEPHDVELTARQVASLQSADLVVYLRGLSPAVDDAVKQSQERLDVTSVTPLVSRAGVDDVHVWLDPVRVQTLTLAVRDRLIALDPPHAADYRDRAAALGSDLAGLDGDFKAGLATCARHELVTSHAAFGYLAGRYGLTQVGISGLVPDAEASPGRLAEVARFARSHGVTTIYFETIVSPKVAQTVATSVGATTAVLDPIETMPTGGYLTGMRANLAALRRGLGCT